MVEIVAQYSECSACEGNKHDSVLVSFKLPNVQLQSQTTVHCNISNVFFAVGSRVQQKGMNKATVTVFFIGAMFGFLSDR